MININKKYQNLLLSREIKVNKKLVNEFNKYFGYRRLNYNRAKELHMDKLGDNYGKSFYDYDDNYISEYDLRDYIKNNLLEEFDDEYSRQIIDTSVQDYFDTYSDFMRNYISSFPKFKIKNRSVDSFRFNMKQWNVKKISDRTFRVDDGKYLKIPRIYEKIGYIKLKEPLFNNKYKDFEKLEGFQMTSVTIKRKSDRYYAIFNIRFKEDSLYKDLPELAAGLDIGINKLAVLSYRKDDKNIYNIIEYTSKPIIDMYNKYDKKIKWYRRSLSKKVFGSKNYLKTRTKLQKIYKKITDFTENYYHNITNEIVNKFMYISVDMFRIKEVIKAFKSKKVRNFIYRSSIYKFYSYLIYKYELYGGFLIEPDDDFNSTNKCSKCGYKLKKYEKISIKERKFTCPKCKFSLNRDINASINLEKYLLKNI